MPITYNEMDVYQENKNKFLLVTFIIFYIDLKTKDYIEIINFYKYTRFFFYFIRVVSLFINHLKNTTEYLK